VLNIWDNLLKFVLMRWSIQLGEMLKTSYRLGVRLLRKATPRVIRFSWLQRLINRLLPCPQMVQRYINPALDIEHFFSILNKRGVRYTILRWFEDMPRLKKGDDVDMLVHDDDLSKIKDLFVVLPTGISCDIYSVSALSGASYRKGVPLYPSHLAREILETSIMYKGIYRVPDTKHYFFSLAYHAVYHKAEMSGLPYAKGHPLALFPGQRSYMEKLLALGDASGIKVSPDLQSLHALLRECGWSPRIDVCRGLAKDSSCLTALLRQTLSGKVVAPETIRYALNVHGVRVLIESDCPAFMEYLRRDFCFFQDTEESSIEPHIRISFLNKEPPWKEIPPQTVPLFKTASSVIYKKGSSRYVDHEGEVLSIYDLERDDGTVYSVDSDALYRIAYSIIMTRLGRRLDEAGYHRTHALGVSVGNEAFVFLADGGCGKTTLGLELMKHPQVGWLTDDIVPVDVSGKALALPTSPRIMIGSVVPWLPPSVTLLKSPMPIAPPKVQIPSWSFLSRVCASAPIGGLYLCTRKPGIGPSFKPAGLFDAFVTICRSGFNTGDFGERLAYSLEFSPVAVYTIATIYISRLWTFMRLAWAVPVFRFAMGGQISENALLLLNIWEAKRKNGVDHPLDFSDAMPAVGAAEIVEQEGIKHRP
jgi:hypothetical protein